MFYTRRDIAGFYGLTIRLGLLRPDAAAAWADAEILQTDTPDEPLVDLALTVGAPADRVIDVLSGIAGSRAYTNSAFRLVGSLLWLKVNAGELTTRVAAERLYAIYRIDPRSAEIFGAELCVVDEFFEPWMMGSTQADRSVREMLRQFAGESLSPI